MALLTVVDLLSSSLHFISYQVLKMLNFDLHVRQPFFSQLKGTTCIHFGILISESCQAEHHKDCKIQTSS